MIKTIQQYKDDNGLTWPQLAARFGANHRQEAQQWKSAGMLVVIHGSTEKLVSVRRERVSAGHQRTLRNNPKGGGLTVPKVARDTSASLALACDRFVASYTNQGDLCAATSNDGEKNES